MSNLRKESGDKLYASEFNRAATFYTFTGANLTYFGILPNYDDLTKSLFFRAKTTGSFYWAYVIGNTAIAGDLVSITTKIDNASSGGFILDGYFHTWGTGDGLTTPYALKRLPISDMAGTVEDYTITGTAPADAGASVCCDHENGIVYIGQGTSLFKYSIDTIAKTLTYIETLTLDSSINSTLAFQSICVSKNYIFYQVDNVSFTRANKTTGATIETISFPAIQGGLSYIFGSVVCSLRNRDYSGEYFLSTVYVD